MRKKIATTLLLISAFVISASAQEKTVVNSAAGKRMLLGSHKLSLQWISWDHFGKAWITEQDGMISLTGEQVGQGDNKNDRLGIDGTVTRIDAREFRFNGKISIQVSHNNNGQTCERNGDMTFRITGKRKYWRLVEMNSPCEGIVDYVDIYFK